MMRHGNPPEAIIWGARFFIRSDHPLSRRTYVEGFAAYSQTGINEVPDGH